MTKIKKQIKSKKRVSDHGEVFTAEREVNAMLDLVKQETERIDSRFLEPACGDSNFLAEILRRKLSVVKNKYGKNPADYEKYSVLAVTSIYRVDILADNTVSCRERLYSIWNKDYTIECKNNIDEDCQKAVKYIFSRNILCGDALTMKQNNGEPIIFAEWSLIKNSLIKRRDFELAHMLEEHTPNLQMDLFGDVGSYEADTNGDLVLKPIKEFSPIDYRKVYEYE